MADGSGGVSNADVRALQAILAKIEESTAYLAKIERRRYRELTPHNGSNFNQFILQVGAQQMDVLNWPYGGADDECSPCLETVTIDVDWTFHDDPSSSEREQAGLDTIDGAYLSVYWGTCSHRADFDLMNGTSVTVSGYKVLLKASYIQAPPIDEQEGLIVVPQPRLAVRASLAPGTKHYGGIVGNARRTVDLGQLGNAGTSARIQIPMWAKEIGIVNSDITVPTMTVNQFGNANNAAVSRWTGTAGKGATDTVPRESYSSWLEVTNTSQNTLSAKVIFYLGR